MLYLSDTFSLGMINFQGKNNVEIQVHEIHSWNEDVTLLAKELPKMLMDHEGGFVSAIRHTETALFLSNILGIDIPVNRIELNLNFSDSLIVVQVVGGRLPKGCTELPDGVSIKFYNVGNISAYSY